ncbi:DUF4238 domain-containing protein [Amnibacterium soli]|uniref:DUF4238 domain-containing protein n=1 Tax=Amnibacterium soli TaxID=1282736 RepID=UPI0031E74C5F
MPRFYLEGFAEQGHLGVAMLPGDKRFTQSTRTAATINDFYLLGSALHPRAGNFEAMLSDFESEASAVFRTLANGTWPLSAQDRAVLGVFIAVQFLRGPEHRQQMTDIRRQMIRLQFQIAGRDRFVKTVAERLQADLSDDEVEELWQLTVRPGGPPIAVRPDQHANELVDLLPKLLKYFLGRPWALVSFERKHLITSDAPVTLVPRRDAQDEEGVGLMTAAAILFPISRSQGLVMADPMPISRTVTVEEVSAGVADLRLPASAAHARSFNSAAVINARRAVFHHPADAALVPDRLPEPASQEAAAPA